MTIRPGWADGEEVPADSTVGGAAVRRVLVPALLLLATILAYTPVLTARFTTWDDPYILTRNPTLNPPTRASLRAWWTMPHQGLYTPVAYTVWGAIAFIAQQPPDPATNETLDPFPFHLANLAIHLVTVLIAFRLLLRLVGPSTGSGQAPSTDPGQGRPWPAAAGALLFALHPVQVESVAHASGIQGLLCVMFGLTAIYQYVRSQDAPGPSHVAQQRIRYVLASLAFVLSVLSKPLGMVVPVVAFALDVVYLGRPWPRAAARLGLWLLLSAACMIWTKRMQPGPRADVDVEWWVRLIIPGDTIAFYLYKLFVPAKFGLIYGRTPSHVLRHDYIFYTWLVPAALAAALWMHRRTLRPLAAAALVFVAGMLPVLGAVKFDFQSYSTVADRYMYLPMLGPAVAAAWLLSRPWCRIGGRLRWLVPACCALLIGLGVRTWFQARVWHDGETLFRNAYRVNPVGGGIRR